MNEETYNSYKKQYVYKGDPRSHIPPSVMASSAMGSNWGRGVCQPFMQKQAYIKPTRPQSLPAMWCFTHLLSSHRTAGDNKQLTNRWNVAGSGISHVYLWQNVNFYWSARLIQLPACVLMMHITSPVTTHTLPVEGRLIASISHKCCK